MNATTAVDAVIDIIDESPPTNTATDAPTDGPPEPVSTPHEPHDNVTSPGDSYSLAQHWKLRNGGSKRMSEID